MSESPTSVYKERRHQGFGGCFQEMDSDKTAEPSLCRAAVPGWEQLCTDPEDGTGSESLLLHLPELRVHSSVHSWGTTHSFPLSTTPSCSTINFPMNCREKCTFQGRREISEKSQGDCEMHRMQWLWATAQAAPTALSGHLLSAGLTIGLSAAAAAAHQQLIPRCHCPCAEEQLIRVTITPTFRNTTFALHTLPMKKHLQMLIEGKGKKTFPSEQSQQEPSVFPSEKNWFCVTLSE